MHALMPLRMPSMPCVSGISRKSRSAKKTRSPEISFEWLKCFPTLSDRKKRMKNSPVIFIKELSEQDRPFMLNHFLGLSPSDRRLRFGAALPDEAVSRYVQRIDFTRDTVFGVYESTWHFWIRFPCRLWRESVPTGSQNSVFRFLHR